jgi:hypothetical protein
MYGNYISFFKGDVLTTNDAKFSREIGVPPFTEAAKKTWRGSACASRWSLDIFAAEPMLSRRLTRGSPRSG